MAIAAAAAVSGVGCHNHVFSPPARTAPLETVETLPVDQTGVQGEIAGHAEPTIGGIAAASGTARVRHGVTSDTDVSVEASLLHVEGDSSASTNRNAYIGRFGVKQRVVPFLAFTAGLGGGGSAAGGFFCPDLGAIVAYENDTIVPFLSYRLSVSQPIGARDVDTSEKSDPPGTKVSKPQRTIANAFTGGVRFPIRPEPAESGKPWASLLLGLSVTHLDDFADTATFLSGTMAVEVVF